MPKKAKELSDAEVRRLAKKPGFHSVGGVAGLHLQVKPPAASWVFKKMAGDRRREYGLGGYPDTTLSRAREKAREYVELIEQGVDPVAERAARRSELMAAQAKQRTFRDVAGAFIEKKAKELKTAKQVQKLTNQLKTYAYPTLGHMVVGDIERAHIVALLKPIWEVKTETATRVRASVERILDMAGAEGLRSGDNPARWVGNLDQSLPKPDKVHKVQHYAALDLKDMPEFMAKLSTLEYMGARALHFAILTAARSGEIRGATWDEIDLNAKVWAIPASRMKGGRAHRVPLCRSAVKLLKALPREGEYLFFNSRGGPLSDVSISKSPKRVGFDVTAHGFRSTFKDWAREHTSYADEVSEIALAHVSSDSTRAAYARSELIDKRRALMNDWEHFCYHGLKKGKVVPMRSRKNG